MLTLVILFIFSSGAYATKELCSINKETRVILEGCSRLKGMNITTVGGTLVNDHNCDVLLPKQVFAEEPGFNYKQADNNQFYTIILVDPDAEQEEEEFYLLMMKSNVPGLALQLPDYSVNSGVDYRNYKAPSPARDSAPHRCIALLYQQLDGNNFIPAVPSRGRFDLDNWLKGRRLCGPIAATQFRTQY